MKKNLKKVISAVISLAMAGSLIPASFAAKVTLSDVADTASYATAVNTLVALGVINGYEDGTFLPDNLITRAEVTKVVVAALNMLEAAEGMSGSTQFTDMDEASAWANGYVNAGVQEGFINGMGDGTFAPKANVTYAQIVKMLVSSLGYDEYAEFMGGYPKGYLALGNSEGVTDGVKANENDNVTRAQVAQLVYNFLNTPVVEKTGMEYSSSGQLVPTLAKMDGKNDNYYKTILTENFDAYYVEGYVTDTPKGNVPESDQVQFGIAKSERYDHEEFAYTGKTRSYDESKANPISQYIYVGDTDAADYQGVYASAIIMVDEYDDYVFISFEPSGKNKTASFDFGLIETEDFEDANEDINITEIPTYLEFYATESASKPTKYNLEKDDNDDAKITLYVNGYAVDATVDNFKKYVLENNVGTIDLVDTYKTNGYYDTIYVSYYETAWVEDVNTTTKKISFKDSTIATLTLDEEKNEDLVYHIYFNGEEITLAELKEDDVLSIAYDVRESKVTDSDIYDIYVARDPQTAKVTGRNQPDEIVTIGGTQYKFVADFPTATEMALGDEYTIYVDYFGRIFKYELDTANANYAIVDKFIYSASEENYRATLFTSEGTTKVYTFDAGNATVLYDGVQQAKSKKEDTKKAAFEAIFEDAYTQNVQGNVKEDITKRVVKYKISSSGYLTYLDFLKIEAESVIRDTLDARIGLEAYKERNNSIGSVKLSAATKIFDGIEYKTSKDTVDLATATLNDLVDDTPYEAYAFGARLTTDGTYPVVLILEGEGAYNATSRFAVVAGTTSQDMDEENNEIYTIPVLYKGEETTIIASDEISTEALALNKGDVFMFLTDSDGYADQIDVIFNFADAKASNYNELVGKAIVEDNEGKLVKYPAAADQSDDFDTAWNSTKQEAIQIVFGPVMTKSTSYYTVGQIVDFAETESDKGWVVGYEKKTDGTDDTTKPIYYNGIYTDTVNSEKDGDGLYDIMINSDTDVYVYDYSEGTNSRLALGTTSSILASKFVKSNTINSGDIIPWNLSVESKTPNKEGVNFALAYVVDGIAIDVLAFNADF